MGSTSVNHGDDAIEGSERGVSLKQEMKEEAISARVRVAVGAVAFAWVAPLAYLAQRLYEVASGVAFTFEWRCLLATAMGGLFAFLAFHQSGRGVRLLGEGGASARLRVAAVLWAALVLFISWWWP